MSAMPFFTLADEACAGDTLFSVSVPLTRHTLIDYARASGDHNPIHQDDEVARSVGLPGVIAHGMWTMGAAGAALSDWLGQASPCAAAAVLSYSTRFTRQVVVPVIGDDAANPQGTAIEVAASIKSIDRERGIMSVDLTVTHDDAPVLGKARAEIAISESAWQR